MFSIALRYLTVAVFLACIMGCAMNQPPIPTHTAQPLSAEFVYDHTGITNDQYLLLPQKHQTPKEWDTLSSGTSAITSSAWSGFGSGGHFAGAQYLNLTIVNLVNSQRVDVFDRQVALGDWYYSFNPPNESNT